MPKQVFLARFELEVAHNGPPKNPKCLEKWDVLGQKMSQKCVFAKMILAHLGCLNK